MAQAIQDIRYALITPDTITTWGYIHSPLITLSPLVFTIAIFVLGAIVFRRKSKFFAEDL